MKCQLCDTSTDFDDGLCDRHAHISLLAMRQTVGQQQAEIERLGRVLEGTQMASKAVDAENIRTRAEIKQLRVERDGLATDLDALSDRYDESERGRKKFDQEIERLRTCAKSRGEEAMRASEIIAERRRLGLLLCPACSGYGTVLTKIDSSQGRMYLRSTCKSCNGSGLTREAAENE